MLNKIILKLKWSIVDFATFFSWKPNFQPINTNVRVIVLHGICLDSEPFINSRFLRQSQLEKLLIGCKDHFHPISIHDLELNRYHPAKMNIVFTFDDGYKNNLELALPLFKKYEVPLTIFCNAVPFHLMDLIDISIKWQRDLITRFEMQFGLKLASKKLKSKCQLQNPEIFKAMTTFLWDNLSDKLKDKSKRYWELLSDDDIQSLAKSPMVYFGNHGSNHFHYSMLNQAEMEKDIDLVKKRFQNLNIHLYAFSFPFGFFNSLATKQVKELGYSMQFADGIVNDSDCQVLERLTINPYISLNNQMIAIVKGHY